MKIYIGYTKNDKRCLEKNPKWMKKINQRGAIYNKPTSHNNDMGQFKVKGWKKRFHENETTGYQG